MVNRRVQIGLICSQADQGAQLVPTFSENNHNVPTCLGVLFVKLEKEHFKKVFLS